MINRCECFTWAVVDPITYNFGNGHNPACPKFVPDVGAMNLITSLVKGIEDWSADADGIHENLYETYRRAVFICQGEIIPEVK